MHIPNGCTNRLLLLLLLVVAAAVDRCCVDVVVDGVDVGVVVMPLCVVADCCLFDVSCLLAVLVVLLCVVIGPDTVLDVAHLAAVGVDVVDVVCLLLWQWLSQPLLFCVLGGHCCCCWCRWWCCCCCRSCCWWR